MRFPVSLRAAFLALFLAGSFAAPVLAQEAVPAPAPSSPAVDLNAAPAAEQPDTAFQASPSTTHKVTVKKKKKKSHDFKKLHAKKKKKAAVKKAVKKRERVQEVDLNLVPNPETGVMEKRGYDPAISEPTEEVMAIKNSAERKYWEGKRPLNGGPVPVANGIVEQPLPMANPNALQRVSDSDLSGVTFDDQPFRLPETDAFRRSIDTVADELGRPCKTHEYFGWPLGQNEQERVNRIFNETVIKFRLRGYGIQPRKPHTAAGDISVFTADSPNPGYAKHVLGMWSAGDVGLLLLVCDSDTPADFIAAQKHTAKELAAKKAKKPAKKKAKKKVEAKPKVIPGAAASTTDAPAAPAPEPAAAVAPAPVAEPAPAAAPAPAQAPMLAPAAPAAAPSLPTPGAAPAAATPPPVTGGSATPPPAVTSTPPASPSATQGNEAPSPVEPAKAAEPQGSTDVAPKGPANSSLSAPASREAAPADAPKSALEKPAQ